MVCRKTEKAAALLIGVGVLVISILWKPRWDLVGIYDECGLAQRLVYSFFHASIIHALLNVWCFLAMVFRYELKWGALMASYAIAAFVPSILLGPTPTVGLSGICFALMGMVAFKVQQKVYFHLCAGLYIMVGLVFESINGWLHLYSYMAGLLVGLLNMPITWTRK